MNAWQLWNATESKVARRHFLQERIGVSAETAKLMATRRFEELSKWIRMAIKKHVRKLRKESGKEAAA